MCNDRPHAMEQTALKEGHLCGSWEMKKKLGMGGFGNVFLFQHLVSTSNRVKTVPLVKVCANYFLYFYRSRKKKSQLNSAGWS